MGKQVVKFLGSEHENNVEDWQYVFVFALPDVNEDAKKKFAEPMEDPKKWLMKIFPKNYKDEKLQSAERIEIPAEVKEGMTRKQFHDFVFKEFTAILAGPLCGFNLKRITSFDEDECFLLVSLTDKARIDDLADKEGFKAKLKPTAYTNCKLSVPTDHGLGNGEFTRTSEDHEKNIDGTPVTNDYCQYVPFDALMKPVLEDLTDADKLRLMRRHIQAFVSLASLEQSGVCLSIFPLHKWSGIEHMYSKGWSKLHNVFHWPREAMADQVFQYMGAELAFFFHWLNFFTRLALIPALASIPVFIARKTGMLSLEQKHYMSMAFAAFVAVWSSCFNQMYKHRKNMKQIKWGMKNFNQETAQVRRQFDDTYRGSWKDHAQHIGHWILCACFVAETMLFTGWIANLRFDAAEDKHGKTFGIPNPSFVAYGKYIITINIKIMDKVWSIVTDKLTSKENWRTAQELKSALVAKIFAVKAFIFFYPFLYVILIQPYAEGCPGDGDMQGCIEVLQSSLMSFFITNFVTEVVMVCVSLFLTRMAIRSEEGKKPGKLYPYLELQAKCPEYTVGDQINDFMNAILNYGFILMFSICLPFMSFLAFIFSVPMKRLTAYKLSYACQRPDPKGAEGIGAWEPVLSILSYAGVSVNCYIAVFLYEPIASWNPYSKFLTFIAAEHVLIALKLTIETMVGDKSLEEKRIEEYHDDTLEVITESIIGIKKGKAKLESKSTPPPSPYS